MTDKDDLRVQSRVARRAGDFDEAARLLSGYLHAHPTDVTVLKDLANVLADLKDNAGVIKVLRRVQAIEPLGPHTAALLESALQGEQRAAAREAKQAGNYAVAVRILSEILEHKPNNIVALKDLAVVFADMGNDQGVIETLEKVQALDGLGTHSRKLYAEAVLRRRLHEAQQAKRTGHRETAIRILKSALTENSRDVVFLQEVAGCAFDLGLNDLARQSLDRARAIQPLPAEYRVVYARASLRVGDVVGARDILSPVCYKPGAPAAAYYHYAEAEIRLGEPDNARAALTLLEGCKIADTKKWAMIGRIYFKLGDLENTLTAFEKCDALGKLEPDDRLIYGRAASRSKDFVRAARILAQDDPKEKAKVTRLILLYEAGKQSGNLEIAEDAAEQLNHCTGTNHNQMMALGRFFRQRGDFDRALAAFDTALKMGGDSYDLSLDIAECDLRQGIDMRARERLEQLLAEKPESPRCHFLLARTLVKQGRLTEAREHFEHVIRLKPEQASAYRELALISTLEAKQDEGIALLQHALTLTPNSGSMCAELAALFLEKGRYKEAREFAERSLLIEPDRETTKTILQNLDLFYDVTSVLPEVSILCPAEIADQWRDIVPEAEVIIMPAGGLQEAAWLATKDWVIPVNSVFSREVFDNLHERLRGVDGVWICRKSAIAAARISFLREISVYYDRLHPEGQDFEAFAQGIGREIYPPLEEETPTQLAPLDMQGKVLLISSSGHNLFGGAEHFLRGLAILYAQMGFKPLIVGHRGAATTSGVTPDGIDFYEFQDDDDASFRAFIIEHRPAIAHVVTGSGPKMMRVAHDLNLPVVYGSHFWREMFNGTGWFPDIDRIASPRRDFMNLALRNETVYVNSLFTLDMQYRYHQLISPIMYSLPANETQAIPPVREGRDIVLLVNARPEKGFDLLLQVAARNPDMKFVAIASQSNMSDAQLAIKAEGLQNIELIGHTNDMEALYRRSWCVMVPSYRFVETFSRVVIESHRAGVPVLGSDRGNVPLLLTESGGALPEDPEAWSLELRRLYEDGEYWAMRSQLALENSERYSFSQQGPILEGLAKKARRPVLVAVGAGIGNIIQCAPAIRRLSEHLGHPVDIIINQDFPGCEWLFAGSPYVGMVFDSKSLAARRRYELVIVLASFGKSVPRFIARRTFIARHKIPFEATSTMHEAKYNLECLVKADIGLEYKEEDVARYFVADRLPTGLESRRIVLHAGGKAGEWAVKRWPRFEELAAALMARGWEVISVGSPSEYVPGTIDCTGKPLPESLSVIQDAAYVIANDSGLMHVADGIGIPLTTIFGPTSVLKNGPLSPGSQVIELIKDCAPCQFNERFRTCKCIADISLEHVLERVLDHLGVMCPAAQTMTSVEKEEVSV